MSMRQNWMIHGSWSPIMHLSNCGISGVSLEIIYHVSFVCCCTWTFRIGICNTRNLLKNLITSSSLPIHSLISPQTTAKNHTASPESQSIPTSRAAQTMDRSAKHQRSSAAAALLVGLLCVVFFLGTSDAAANVNVGGRSGWTLGYNYRTWASTTRVNPWDSLFFKYDPRLHNVLLVSKADFDACRTTSPWAKYSSGKDYIKFTNSGTYYLICGVANHCAAGMKVAVTVKW